MAFVPDKPESSFKPDSQRSSFVADTQDEEVERPKASRLSATTDVLNRGIVAGTLGAPVDIAAMAMRPFGYKEEAPFLGSEYIGRQMERAGMVTPTRRPLAELAAGLAPAVVTGGAGLVRGLYGAARTALGRPVEQAATALQRQTAQQLERPIAEAEQARARAAGTIEQIERQPRVSAQRAATSPLTPEQETAILQAQLRQPVREKAAAAARTAEQQAEAAKARVLTAQGQIAQAERAVADLEQQLLSRPQISGDEFGRQLRLTTEGLYKSLIGARKEGTNFEGVLAAASTNPTVNTAPLIAKAQKIASQSRNPTVISMMSEIQGLAKSGDLFALNLRQADSLRKTLSKDIINKYFPQTGADKETLMALKDLRRELINEAPSDYKKALAEFRVLSRPLDIMERKGALRPIIDVDPLSTAERLTEAEVLGVIINKARTGNPTFSRLLEQSPQLKDTGRLYFTQDLFGKGAVPSEASFRTWLSTNERPLRQLGLFNEFRDLRLAREASNRAVQDAKLGAQAAEQTAKTASQKAKEAGELSVKSRERLEKALGTAASPTQRPGETLAEALRRSRGVQPAPIQTFISTRDQAQSAVDALTFMQNRVNLATSPQEVQQAVQATAKLLLDRKIIDDAGYRTMIREVQTLKDLTDARSKARRTLLYFGGLAGAGAATGQAFDFFSSTPR